MPTKCPKYKPKTVARILEMYAEDNYTIGSICKAVGIAERTFRMWRDEHPEFAEALEDAERRRMENFTLVARNSLMKKLRGYDTVETSVETKPGKEIDPVTRQPKPVIVSQTTKKRHVAADTAAIIFTLTNGDPQHWKNRQNNEVTGKDGKDLFGQMTDEELDAIIQEHQRKLK